MEISICRNTDYIMACQSTAVSRNCVAKRWVNMSVLTEMSHRSCYSLTACTEFIDLHGQQICLSSVHGLSWCAVVCFGLSALFRKSSCLISNSSNIDCEFGMFG